MDGKQTASLPSAVETQTIHGMICEAIGQASMCWSETPVGVFDSDQAIQIADELSIKIVEQLKHQIQGFIFHRPIFDAAIFSAIPNTKKA